MKKSKNTFTKSATIKNSETPTEIIKKSTKVTTSDGKKHATIQPEIVPPSSTIETVNEKIEIQPEIPVIKKTSDTKIRPEIVSFYSNSIRNTFMNNQWYFSLEDILRIAKVVDPTKFLIELKNHDSLVEEYYNLVETFSYYEADSPIIIPIINYQNFIKILPTIRKMGFFMPGPFPEWLKNMAHRKF